MVQDPLPGLAITKAADKTVNVSVGELITYTYVVTNTGNTTLSNVSLNDVHGGSGLAPVPTNESLSVDNNTTGDSTDGAANNGVWDTLGSGDEITFTGTYTVTQNDIDTLQ